MDTLLAPLLSLLARVALFPLPHSGQYSPRPYGDFEAHRHWLDVTHTVPLRHWYVDGPGNDLQYWGLDYPPLFAYFSWALGWCARYLAPGMAMREGHHGWLSKVFMRSSVVGVDALTLVVAGVFLATRVMGGLKSGVVGGEGSNGSQWVALMLLLHPAQLLIDHGHFQYNGGAVGLSLLAALALLSHRPLLSAILFTLALHFKHTSLYYAPVFFTALLAQCWVQGLEGLIGGGGQQKQKQQQQQKGAAAPSTPTILSRTLALGLVGVAVVLTAAPLWLPFCVSTAAATSGTSGGLSMEGCVMGLGAVASRLAPLERGLYEDAVANIWYTIEPLTKLQRDHFHPGTPATLSHRVMAGACSLAALTLALPSLFLLARAVMVAGGMGGGGGGGGGLGVGAGARAGNKGKPSFFFRDSGTLTRHLLLTLHTTSLAFFLASYHVHEKAVLFPALPLALLAPFLPAISAHFAAISLASLWPLLTRDGLSWGFLGGVGGAYLLLAVHSQASVSNRAHTALVYPWTRNGGRGWRGLGEWGALETGWRVLVGGKGSSSSSSSSSSFYTITRVVAVGAGVLSSLLLASLTVAAWRLVPLPPSLPFLHQRITMSLCTLLGLGHLGVGTLIQLGWTAMEEGEGEGEGAGEGGEEEEVVVGKAGKGKSRTGGTLVTQEGSKSTSSSSSSVSVGGGKKKGGRKASASRGPREKIA